MSYQPYRSGKNVGYGPVTGALDVRLPAKRENDVPSATLSLRIRTQTTNHRMQRFRSMPIRRRAWFVTLTKTKVTERMVAAQLVVGLPFREYEFWLHSRRMAKQLVIADQRIGGTGNLFPVEYRRCCVCERVLLAAEAQTYRLKMRRPFWKWEYKEGPACGVECRPPQPKRRPQSNAA